MKNRFFRCWDAVALWLLCLAMSGCSSMAPGSENPCFSCDDQRLVRIVSFAQGPASDQGRRLHHPLVLGKHEWEAVLRTVNVRGIHNPLLGSSYQGATEPAFSEEEVRYLGESLQRAFQQATAHEQVVFAMAVGGGAGSRDLRRLVCGARPDSSAAGQLPGFSHHAVDPQTDLG